MIRAFVAAELPEAVRLELEAVQQQCQDRRLDFKWVSPASLHLTLKFLGDIPQETFLAALQALDTPLVLGGPLRLSVGGVGAFPSARRARILWAGLEGDLATLSRAARQLDTRVARVGIAREAREFSPHITLGRARGSSGTRDVTALVAEPPNRGPAFEVTALVVFQSVPGRGGPVHTPRKTIALS